MIAAQVAFALIFAAAGSHAGAVQQRLIWPDISGTTELYANQPASVEFCFQGHVRNDQEKWKLNLEQSSWFGAKYDLKANFTSTTDECYEAKFTVPAQAKTAHNYRFRLARSRAWWFRRNYEPSKLFTVWSVKDSGRLFNENLPVTRESINNEAMPFVVDEPLDSEYVQGAPDMDTTGEEFYAALENKDAKKIYEILQQFPENLKKSDLLVETALIHKDYDLLALAMTAGSVSAESVRFKAFELGLESDADLNAIIDAIDLQMKEGSPKPNAMPLETENAKEAPVVATEASATSPLEGKAVKLTSNPDLIFEYDVKKWENACRKGLAAANRVGSKANRAFFQVVKNSNPVVELEEASKSREVYTIKKILNTQAIKLSPELVKHFQLLELAARYDDEYLLRRVLRSGVVSVDDVRQVIGKPSVKFEKFLKKPSADLVVAKEASEILPELGETFQGNEDLAAAGSVIAANEMQLKKSILLNAVCNVGGFAYKGFNVCLMAVAKCRNVCATLLGTMRGGAKRVAGAFPLPGGKRQKPNDSDAAEN